MLHSTIIIAKLRNIKYKTLKKKKERLNSRPNTSISLFPLLKPNYKKEEEVKIQTTKLCFCSKKWDSNCPKKKEMGL